MPSTSVPVRGYVAVTPFVAPITRKWAILGCLRALWTRHDGRAMMMPPRPEKAGEGPAARRAVRSRAGHRHEFLDGVAGPRPPVEEAPAGVDDEVRLTPGDVPLRGRVERVAVQRTVGDQL